MVSSEGNSMLEDLGVNMEWGDLALAKCKHWLVLEPLVYIMPRADPKQTVKDKLAVKGRGDILEGDGVKVEGYRWLKVRHDASEAWILIDGRAVGANRCFLEPVPG
ncbi:unnamed protein product [Polarella glacialis]|uniref:Uncharacterized protein n=1 Tax=Polarella glacialis TaxID=89957 RepID=A0A813LZV4_POLGL|nr:unnamed protein product [Polarella glacialis]CAE8651179.1 unnamed protein product [Polarella glacialis]CAE8742202.1 unnamed protein product [Polarella glacialis]